ncbi:odorant receptor 46a-like [Diachasmimorpha longicaudata]|uniref:odorant receptor 46a-like n=1 Tax=Diachasmimorpha longicaudata TaxID=58733 RepID=UPI0030B8F97B
MAGHRSDNSSEFFHKETFLVLKYLGFWKPEEMSKWKSILYNIYSTLILTLFMTFGLFQFLGILLLNRPNQKVFIQNIFITLTTICVCFKSINWIHYRPKVVTILEMLKQHPFKCQTSKECMIYQHFSSKIRRILILPRIYVMIVPLHYVVDQLFTTLPQRTLPLSAWLPYDYSTLSGQWLSSIYLGLGLYVGAQFEITYDILFFELMMQIVGQVKILKNRFQLMMATLVKANGTRDYFTKNHFLPEHVLFHSCVQYHIAIVRLARDINSIFAPIMMIQYLVTSLALSSTVYLMSETLILSREFLKLGGYWVFIFQEMLLLCYAAHRTYLEFDGIGDVLYNSDWIALSETTKQSVMLMMVNTKKPFVFNCVGMLKLDIEAFKKALMLAYSIYNIF